jgi:outer membrane protein assembly factor BamB
MKKKLFLLIGILLAASLVLSGCAAGLTASSWPAAIADANNAYLAGGSYVYAVNLETGAMVWRFPAKASPAAPFYATPALTADGKQLIVGGFDHKLYSLDVATGTSKWEFDGAHDRWLGGALVTADMVYAPNADYNLYALDLTGNLKWNFTADQSIWGTPVTDGQRIYFGDLGRHVYAVDAKSGQKAWEKTLDGAVLGSPAIAAGGLLYVSTYNGTVFALDPATGQTRWHFAVAQSQWMWNGPTLDAKNVYVGDSSGMVYALDLAGGKPAWQQKMSGSVLGSPVLAGGNLVVGTEAENVAFLDGSGAIVHTATVTGKVYATPAVSGSLVLVAMSNTDATLPILVALDASGALKWSFIPPK